MNKSLFFILLIVFAACAPAPKFTKRYEAAKESSEINKQEYLNTAPVDTFTGVASYYAHKYHGRLTANGEIYDMYGLSAAHPNWPFETIIRVTNLKNNRSAIIRVNDRMPFRPDRIIDLSLGTAKELDMIEDGIVEIKLEILKWGEEL